MDDIVCGDRYILSEDRNLQHKRLHAYYRKLKENFFEVRGYELVGDVIIIGEGEPGFEEACKKSEEKYRQWKMRIKQK